MRGKALILTLLPLFAGCKLDILGPADFDLGLGGGGGGWPIPTPNFELTGKVSIGGWTAYEGEATVYFYRASDPVTPVDSAPVYPDGLYRRSWWDGEAVPNVCDWVGQAVLWSGEKGDPVPLFDSDIQSCHGNGDVAGGVAMPVEYEPLTVPFVVTGRVLSNDEPAQVEVALPARTPDFYDETVILRVTSDAEGYYSFEATDAPQRFAWCRWISTVASGPEGVQEGADLWQIYDMRACTDGRVFPDIRFGSSKAITGHMQFVSLGDVYRPAATAEAKVSLVDPTDSLTVLGPVETLDDGSFHMWWSVEDGFPGCDFLIEVEIEDRPSAFYPMIQSTQGCYPNVDRWITVR